MTRKTVKAPAAAKPEFVTPAHVADAARAMLEDILTRGVTALTIIGSAGSNAPMLGSVPNNEAVARGMVETVYDTIAPR